MGFLHYVKRLLTGLLYKLGWESARTKALDAQQPEDSAPEGTQGRIDAEAALLLEDDRAVLSVGFDFADVPSWVEWDLRSGRLSVAQMGGALAELSLDLPRSARDSLRSLKRLALVTGNGPDKLMHYIAFIVRE
jgi:hypothetical protein